jgi:hypothetical protein
MASSLWFFPVPVRVDDDRSQEQYRCLTQSISCEFVVWIPKDSYGFLWIPMDS